MEKVHLLILQLIQSLKVLNSVFVFTTILDRWILYLLISFDLNNKNVVALFDKEVRIEEASLWVFGFPPRVFNVEFLV